MDVWSPRYDYKDVPVWAGPVRFLFANRFGFSNRFGSCLEPVRSGPVPVLNPVRFFNPVRFLFITGPGRAGSCFESVRFSQSGSVFV